MTDRLYGIRRMLPTPGGGLHAGIVPRLVSDLGTDFAMGVGGAVHGHPMGAAADARAVRQALHAAIDGESLATAGAAHAELGAALALWPEMGVLSEPTTA